MLIWTIAIVVIALLGVSSYYKGAIRSMVSLIGLFVAIALALPLAPHLKPLVPKLGLVHPIWPYVLPPVIVFVVVALIFVGLGFLVHHKVAMHYKYATDDYTRVRWERLNRKLGLCVGILAGGIYTLLLGLVIYIFGYPAVQVTNDNSPQGQRLLSQARQQLTTTGLDKSVSALDPMPDNYYLISDLVGLVYNNNSLHERLANYPAFLEFAERQEFKDIVTDTEIMGGLQTQAPIIPILNNPKILGLLDNAEIMEKLRQVDLKDLYRYLETGTSAKFQEPILGRWRINIADTYILARRQNPDMTSKQMRAIKTLLVVWLPNFTLMATPDGNIYPKVELSREARAFVDAARSAIEAAQQAAAQNNPYGDPTMQQRYGLGPGYGQEPPEGSQRSGNSLADLTGVPQLDMGTGSWERRGRDYRISFTQGNNNRRGTATIDEDTLKLDLNGMTYVFLRTMLQ